MKLKNLLLVLSVLLCLPSMALAGGILDGKTFSGSMGNKGQAANNQDDIVLQNGKFNSVLCNRFGYGAADYTATAQGDAINFKAQTTNAKGGQMNWEGTVKGDTLKATNVTVENGQTSESWFKGTLKK